MFTSPGYSQFFDSDFHFETHYSSSLQGICQKDGPLKEAKKGLNDPGVKMECQIAPRVNLIGGIHPRGIGRRQNSKSNRG